MHAGPYSLVGAMRAREVALRHCPASDGSSIPKDTTVFSRFNPRLAVIRSAHDDVLKPIARLHSQFLMRLRLGTDGVGAATTAAEWAAFELAQFDEVCMWCATTEES